MSPQAHTLLLTLAKRAAQEILEPSVGKTRVKRGTPRRALGEGDGAMKVLCATLLVLLPSVCVALCKTATATLKVKIGASEANKGLLVKKLNEHGCNHGLQFELVDDGFDYRIFLLDVLKPRMTLTQAGVGSAYESVVLTTVFDDKGSVLFEFGRGNRFRGALQIGLCHSAFVLGAVGEKASGALEGLAAKDSLICGVF